MLLGAASQRRVGDIGPGRHQERIGDSRPQAWKKGSHGLMWLKLCFSGPEKLKVFTWSGPDFLSELV